MHRTEIFFLFDDGAIRRIPQATYADVVSGRATVPELARLRVRVADWYTRHPADGAVEIDNETYTVLYFDEVGSAQLFPEPDLIAENKSLHAATVADPYSGTADRSEVEHRAVSDTEFRWRPSDDERSRMLGELERA